ncbi:MAG: translation initiation factor IF-2 [Gammaproteobacteria bacterium]|nr:translation initiation factor IF-2 [Gammaproteobacteria bacterium]MYD75757.1 translation initiation factor IF-2 [Gammaproteobacteria bacterium]
MSKDTVESYAKKLGITTDKLLDQLRQAGVQEKMGTAILEESEKNALREFKSQSIPSNITRSGQFSRQKTLREDIRRPTQAGPGRAVRSVRVERKVKRKFIDRRILEAELAKQAAAEEEARKAKELAEQARQEEEARKSEQEKSEADAAQAETVLRDGSGELEAGASAEGEGLQGESALDEGLAASPDSEAAVSNVGGNGAEPVGTGDVDDRSQKVDASAAAAEADPEGSTAKSRTKGKRKPMPQDKPGGAGGGSEEARKGEPRPGKKGKSQPDSTKTARKKDGKKWRMGSWGADDEEAGGREELHALRRRERKKRPVGLRKPGSISTPMARQHGFEKPTAPVVHEVVIPETITVGDLAQAISVKAGEVVKKLFQMGSMVTINQLLDQDTAILLVEEMGHVAKPAVDEDAEAMLMDKGESVDLVSRPPVVTVMGHVDHGKTSLLDHLRNAKVAAGEAGGITQHIGAYKVRLNDQEICFLDTPGHEAFTAMRARGARATDLVILVVAADDGVKPQTVEAINHAKSAGVPIVVAINKIDREESDSERVRQELSNHELIPEEWGGDVLMNEVSAITGQGVDSLLESVLIQAELCDLKARPSGQAAGLVIEARLDKGKGPVATVLVQQGVLKRGDIVLAGEQTGRVRVINDDRGQKINQAGPSTPVEIQGLAGVPVAGDDLIVVGEERIAREIASSRQGKSKEVKLAQQQKSKFESAFNRMEEAGAKTLNILVKADVQGSVEALRESLVKLSGDEVSVKVVHGMVGGINESDVNLAKAVDAIIVGFNVRADAAARKLIESEGVPVFYHSIIYDVVDTVKARMTGLMDYVAGEQHVGLVEVRDVFRSPKMGAIAGCYVTEGLVKRNLPVRVLRDNIVIFEGAINSLRRFKDDVNEVKSGYECGIGIKNYNDVKVGDQIEVYEVVQIAPSL